MDEGRQEASLMVFHMKIELLSNPCEENKPSPNATLLRRCTLAAMAKGLISRGKSLSLTFPEREGGALADN